MQTKDFVRHTCDEAVITVLVSNGPDKNPTKVQRRIHAQAGTQRSTFKIDDYEATLEEVRRKCRDWNIQLDNLCQARGLPAPRTALSLPARGRRSPPASCPRAQFLPQDRVVEFARLSGNPEDLLLQTERAVGNGELHQQHTHLIETKDNFDNACAELTTLEKQVSQFEPLQVARCQGLPVCALRDHALLGHALLGKSQPCTACALPCPGY